MYLKKTFFFLLSSAAGALVFFIASFGYMLWKSNLLSAIYPLLKVSTHIEHSYIENMSAASLKERILSGFVETLDPHSAYLTAAEYQKMTDDLQAIYGGIGITGKPKLDEGHILVQDVQENGPAFLAGLRKGDKILEVNGIPISTLKNEAFERIRGPINTQVSLMVHQENSLIKTLSVERKNIQVPTVQWATLQTQNGDPFLYFKVRQFNEKLIPELVDVLETQLQVGTQGLILDLRNNPGGLVPAAVGLAGIFLPSDSVVLSIRHKNRADTILTARPDDWAGPSDVTQDPILNLKAQFQSPLESLPLYILINEGSASASELVSAALKEHKRATIVGVRSFGKGSVQSLLPLGDEDGALKLTTSLYYSPLGISLQSKGVTPDIEIQPTKPIASFRESDLPGHIKGPEESSDSKPTSIMQRKQMEQALGEQEEPEEQTSIFTQNILLNLKDPHFIEIEKHFLRLRSKT